MSTDNLKKIWEDSIQKETEKKEAEKRKIEKVKIVKNKRKPIKRIKVTTPIPSGVSVIDNNNIGDLIFEFSNITFVSKNIYTFRKEKIKLELKVKDLLKYLKSINKIIDYNCHIVYYFYNNRDINIIEYFSTIDVIQSNLLTNNIVKWISVSAHLISKKEKKKIIIKIIKL